MDALLLEQHLRSPLRLFPDPLMAQFAAGPDLQDAASSAALLEKARQHLQMWSRSPYSELLLPQMYQRPPNLGLPLNLGVWQNSASWPTSPPQLPPGFLPNAAAAAAVAAAAAADGGGGSRQTPPPLPPGTLGPAPLTPTSSSGSPSPDPRAKHFTRFTPYQIPQAHSHPQAPTAAAPPQPPPPAGSPRSSSN
uniref:Uncharacterized protein n=1 Tax=Anopheles dirus TaxID=7168 RepID=A0A182NT98_9DIPT